MSPGMFALSAHQRLLLHGRHDVTPRAVGATAAGAADRIGVLA
jgi:hypothetical protein